MRHIFVFLLIGLVSCGDDASSNTSENAKLQIEEYWVHVVAIVPNFHNGTHRTDEAFFKKDMKPLTGIVKENHKNNILKSKITFIEGKKDGLEREWYEDGQLKMEWSFKKGISDGICKRWYENGQLECILNYKDGCQVGEEKNGIRMV